MNTYWCYRGQLLQDVTLDQDLKAIEGWTPGGEHVIGKYDLMPELEELQVCDACDAEGEPVEHCQCRPQCDARRWARLRTRAENPLLAAATEGDGLPWPR